MLLLTIVTHTKQHSTAYMSATGSREMNPRTFLDETIGGLKGFTLCSNIIVY